MLSDAHLSEPLIALVKIAVPRRSQFSGTVDYIANAQESFIFAGILLVFIPADMLDDRTESACHIMLVRRMLEQPVSALDGMTNIAIRTMLMPNFPLYGIRRVSMEANITGKMLFFR